MYRKLIYYYDEIVERKLIPQISEFQLSNYYIPHIRPDNIDCIHYGYLVETFITNKSVNNITRVSVTKSGVEFVTEQDNLPTITERDKSLIDSDIISKEHKSDLTSYIRRRLKNSISNIHIHTPSIYKIILRCLYEDTIVEFKTSIKSCLNITNYIQLLIYWCIANNASIPINKLRLFNPLLGEEAEINMNNYSYSLLLNFMIDRTIIPSEILPYKHNFTLRHLQYYNYNSKQIRYHIDKYIELLYITDIDDDKPINLPTYKVIKSANSNIVVKFKKDNRSIDFSLMTNSVLIYTFHKKSKWKVLISNAVI